MSAFFVALRESVRDPEEIKLYAQEAHAVLALDRVKPDYVN